MTEAESSYQIIRYAPSATALAFRLARGLKKALPVAFASAEHTNQERKDRVASAR